MATETAGNNQCKAMTEPFSNLQWQELESVLGMGVQRRLARVDRALFASSWIAQMLNKDRLGKSDAHDNDSVSYVGLNTVDVEALSIALIELGQQAQEALAEVRDNVHGCWGRLLKDRNDVQL